MDMSKLFAEYIEGEENYRIAYDIVRGNSVGRIWLIGGALSRNLNQLIHGTVQRSFDFDFVVEESKEDIEVPEGWVVKKNKFGNPKFVKGDMSIDFVPLKSFESLKRDGAEATIENVLRGVPFTIQALAYDVEEKRIVGDVGIKAFENKVFEVNDLEEALRLADRKGVELNDLISKKAESMGFVGVMVGASE